MRVSRAPEGRGATKQIALLTVGLGAIIAIVVVVILSMGSDEISAKNDQSLVTPGSNVTAPQDDSQSVALAPTATTEPTVRPEPTAVPTSAPKPAVVETSDADQDAEPRIQPDPTPQAVALTFPRVLPDAKFGEVLEDGLVSIKLPQGQLIKSWFTLQVDTQNRDITLFFAQYDDSLESIESTVKVDNYARGEDLTNAEVVLTFPDGTERTLLFDRATGTISLTQQYLQPVGPSMFSSSLRRSLVFFGMQLQDDTGETQIQLHLDLSGLSQSEALEFKRMAPETVNDVLLELRYIVEQIEEQRET